MKTNNLLKRIFYFYYDGFRNMTVGKRLWIIIIIKLIVIFGVLKIFFFPNFLQTNFSTDNERSEHVLYQITDIDTIKKTDTLKH